MYKNDKVIRRYSKPFKLKTKDEITGIKQQQKEIEQLKKLLLKKDMDVLVDESYLEVAAEQPNKITLIFKF